MSAHGAEDFLQSTTEPRNLPFCTYPKGSDVSKHGLQELPERLPKVKLEEVRPYRNKSMSVVCARDLDASQMLQIAEIIAEGFSKKEPQLRYIRIPKYPPEGLLHVPHTDVLGTEMFGEWNMRRLLYWFTRLFILTDITAPLDNITLNEDLLKCSLVTLNPSGEVLGTVINKKLDSPRDEPAYRQDDIFMLGMQSLGASVHQSILRQETQALDALCTKYTPFREAYENGKVGYMWMLARSENLPKENMFELVAASAELLQHKGCSYMITEGSNQWTGAACEALGGVRVHYAPFQGWHAVKKSDVPLEGVVTSANGWMSDKDSGVMLYVVRFT